MMMNVILHAALGVAATALLQWLAILFAAGDLSSPAPCGSAEHSTAKGGPR